MSSRSRRKVTAESGKTGSDSADPAKPSVFERLGAGAMRRSYEESGETNERCRNWLKTGNCMYGNKCRYVHVKRDQSPEDLRWRVPRKRKGRRSGENTASEDEKESARNRSRGRKDKDVKMKSAVVISKPSAADSDNADSDPWPASGASELEYDATWKLMKKRQRLQQELSLLEDDDGGSVKESDITTEKPMESATPGDSGRKQSSRHPEPSASQDSTSKKKREKKRRRKNKGPRTPSPNDGRVTREGNRSPPIEERPRNISSSKQNRGRASRSRSPIADRVSRSGSSRSVSPPIHNKKRTSGYREADRAKSPVAVQPSRSASDQHRGDGGRPAEGRKSSRKSGDARDVGSPRRDSSQQQQQQQHRRDRSLSQARDSTANKRHAQSTRQQPRSSPRQRTREVSERSSSEASSSSDDSSSSGSSSSSDSSSESEDDTSMDESPSKKKEKNWQGEDRSQNSRRGAKGDRERVKQGNRSTSPQRSRENTSRKQGDERKAGRDRRSPASHDARQGDMGQRDRRGRRDEHETADQRNTRDGRDSLDRRDTRDQRGQRDQRYRNDQRDMRDPRNQGDPAELRGQRDHKYPRDQGTSRDARGGSRDSRNQRDDRAPRNSYGRNRMLPVDGDMWLDNPVDAPMLPSRLPTDERMLPLHPERPLRQLSPILRQDLMYRDNRFDRLDPGLRPALRGYETYNEHELYRQQTLLPPKHPYPEPAEERFPPLLPPPLPEVLLDRYGRERVPLQKLMAPSRDMPMDRHDDMHRRRNYAYQGREPSPPPPQMLNPHSYLPLQNPGDMYHDTGNKKRMSRRQQWEEQMNHEMMLASSDISPRRMDEMLRSPSGKRRCGNESPTRGGDWDWGRRSDDKGRGGGGGGRGDERRGGDRWRRRHRDDEQRSGHDNKDNNRASSGDGQSRKKKRSASREAQLSEDGSNRGRNRNRSLSQAADDAAASTGRRGGGGSPAAKVQDRDKGQTEGSQKGDSEGAGNNETPGDKKTTAGAQETQNEGGHASDDLVRSHSPGGRSMSSRHSHQRDERSRDRRHHHHDKMADTAAPLLPLRTASHGVIVPPEFELEFKREFEREQRLCEREFQARGRAALDWLDGRGGGGGGSGSGREGVGADRYAGGRHRDEWRDEGGRWQRSHRDSPRNSERDKRHSSSEKRDSPQQQQQQQHPDRTAPTQAVSGSGTAGDKDADTKVTGTSSTKVDEDKGHKGAMQGDGSGYDDISDEDLDNLIGKVEQQEDEVETADSTSNKSGVVDTLHINWSSMSARKSPVQPVSVFSYRKRFMPEAILSRLGVSRSLAGDALCQKVEQLCQQKSESAKTDTDTSVEKNNAAPLFSLLNNAAALHARAASRANRRADLVCNIGPYRRALCARRDIDIRRQLCKLEPEQDGLGQFALVPAVDQDIYKQSLQLLNPNRCGKAMATKQSYRAEETCL